MKNPFEMGKGYPANDNASAYIEAQEGVPDSVYLRRVDDTGKPRGEAFHVFLAGNTVDISALPQDLQQQFYKEGLRVRFRDTRVYPGDGKIFIESLIRYSARVWRIDYEKP